jgi:putative nucleotidyltransferase with HDIG domain
VAGTAFALSFQSSVFNDRGYEAEVRGLWAHAIATAFYAKAVAGTIGHNQDAVFLCGLLHSIGKPFVVHTVNDYHPASASPLPWSTILSLMDQSYVEVGRQLADEWNFPPSVKEAINLHQPHSYHLATSPTKGAPITCLARELASVHSNSLPISTERLRTLPVVRALNIADDVMDGISQSKQDIQVQIDSLLI